ncbi:uncharacterized protein LOC127847340 isoform X2 [Dreissena polymorpha]|uniref:uncharacterized protein LOC127847340 isoform X2 n=1 Tax=Dreissena polymorpha TaxID=45954 RepID=UPI002263C8C7|nr:uncharacterized protein LOC127847340 isoform X2 [Dreissena polymorpha]
MRHIVQAGELRGLCLRNSIRLMLKIECCDMFENRLITLHNLRSSHSTFEQDLKYVIHKFYENSTNVIRKAAAIEWIKHLYALHISMQGSSYLRLRNVLDSENIRRVQYCFNSDVASSRLKFASMLYCGGHLRAAVRVLKDVEGRYHSNVKTVCGCRIIQGDRDLKVFANMLSGNTDNEFSKYLTFCVKLLRQESYCTPFILLFEMNRNISEEEVAQRSLVGKQWMDIAEVDARPFLHYLQYLTYGGLGERGNQLYALRFLNSYICDARNRIHMYHFETSLNLLGHCYEMEGNYESALYYYEKSLLRFSTNNAANWHVRRVLRIISG